MSPRFEKILCVFLIIYVTYISAQNDATTVAWITVSTTTEAVEIITDIPQSEVEQALNVDVGEYTTQLFDYINTQFHERNAYEKCYEDYLKCLVTQGMSTPVCAINDVTEYYDGFITYNSYCDVYFDNCRRGGRFWRIYDIGKCSFSPYKSEYTRRKFGAEYNYWPIIHDIFGPWRMNAK